MSTSIQKARAARDSGRGRSVTRPRAKAEHRRTRHKVRQLLTLERWEDAADARERSIAWDVH